MRTEALERVCAAKDVSILEALAIIDRGAHAMCCIVDESDHLVAVLTDGDVRRALLGGASLDSPALNYASTSPRTVRVGTSRAHVLDLMRSLSISALPEIDDVGRLVNLHTLSEITGATPLANPAVIMAGGKGTRLGELTRTTPKPLMTVAGRPIIEWIILGLVSDGVRNIYVSVNHLADQIVEHLGTGEAFGCSINYLTETPDNPLSTAGSLTLLPPEVTAEGAPPIIVMNGDLMVEFDTQTLLDYHASKGSALTIGTRAYTHRVPFGVLQTDSSRQVTDIVEKPDIEVEINTAIYCVQPELIGLLPYNQSSTMPDLAQICLDSGRAVTAWSITGDWIDVGTPNDLARAKGQ